MPVWGPEQAFQTYVWTTSTTKTPFAAPATKHSPKQLRAPPPSPLNMCHPRPRRAGLPAPVKKLIEM